MTEPMQEERPWQPWDGLVDKWRRQIVKTDPYIASPEERRVFYELIMKIHWLAPRIRREVAKELGISLQDEKLVRSQFRTDITKFRIKAHTERMKPSGLSYRDRREAALSKVAEEDDISVGGVLKQLERNSDAKWTAAVRKRTKRDKGRQK
jgi:hypothetical protein